MKPYAAWLRLLVEHYIDLLKADGSRADACIRKSYGSRTHYLLFLNRLKKAEARLNEALMPGLTADNSDVPETIRRMESAARRSGARTRPGFSREVGQTDNFFPFFLTVNMTAVPISA